MSSATEIRTVAEAPGYQARRTLPLRVEAMRQLRRRRTLLMGGVLAALPFILIIAFAIGGTPGGGDGGGGGGGGSRINLMDVATESAANFAATSLFVSAGFLLVVPVALFCGDTVASEASWSSLRYLLAAPVPRSRLLWSKLVVALGFSLAAMVLLPLVALGAGAAAYGWGPLRLPTGGALATSDTVPRLALVVAFIFVSQLVTAGLAFWLSTKTDAPLGAVGGAVGLTIVGNVLDAVTALGGWRDFLPAHWQFAWADALQPDLEWGGMAKGAAVSVTYALILFALAFRGFSRKDIVS
ncbi:ABC transporter permease [Streptomyces sp. NPDC048590]|uniref:ABC transporter permease n=1 Tax=Streptomyces sp. NPDC048590 TaxID=3365574 RepID=UPI00371C257A